MSLSTPNSLGSISVRPCRIPIPKRKRKHTDMTCLSAHGRMALQQTQSIVWQHKAIMEKAAFKLDNYRFTKASLDFNIPNNAELNICQWHFEKRYKRAVAG